MGILPMIHHPGAPGEARATILIAAAVLLVGLAGPAVAVQVQDLVRIKGAESSRVIGMGLVIGLDGTGDGAKSATTMRRLAAMMNQLGDPIVTADELAEAKNVAVVYLSARIPAGGVREGDAIDAQLAAPTATSLEGGRLVLTPMLGPLPGSAIYAFAEGPVTVEDPELPRTGVVRAGATLTRDIYARYLDEDGRMTLVLDEHNATWPMANTIATLINDLMAPDAAPIAAALDQKNVIVRVPPAELASPAAFISQVLETHIDPSMIRTEARVVVNRRTGTIVMTQNVEISPVVISHRGLTITTITPNGGGEAPDAAEGGDFAAIEGGRRGGARLADLLAAFTQLGVPAEDRIAILQEIDRTGKLHARLIVED